MQGHLKPGSGQVAQHVAAPLFLLHRKWIHLCWGQNSTFPALEEEEKFVRVCIKYQSLYLHSTVVHACKPLEAKT